MVLFSSLLSRYLLLWFLFFLICLGLGFPTLNRYEPPTIPGLSDTTAYSQLVTGEQQYFRWEYMRGRVLVPYVAKPFYWFARSHLKTWSPVFFGLLVANSLFCASSACLLLSIARQLNIPANVGLLAATLYLLNFAVPNLQLAGMIDSGESFFMLALVATLLAGQWPLMLAWGILGALAKETFVPFALVFTTAWWITADLRTGSEARFKRLAWLIAFAVVSVATLIAVHSLIAHRVVWPWAIAAEANARVSLFQALVGEITNHNFWYVFGWLLPFGIWKLKRLPRPWLMASLFTAIIVLAFGAWKDMGGTVGRPLFDVVGPMLTLSTAILLSELWNGDSIGSKDNAVIE
jgi:uncharacterized membrane protein